MFAHKQSSNMEEKLLHMFIPAFSHAFVFLPCGRVCVFQACCKLFARKSVFTWWCCHQVSRSLMSCSSSLECSQCASDEWRGRGALIEGTCIMIHLLCTTSSFFIIFLSLSLSHSTDGVPLYPLNWVIGGSTLTLPTQLTTTLP